MSHSVAIGDISGLSGGEICAFMLRATNAEGQSADSAIFSAAFADVQTTVSTPVKDSSLSTRTSITISWAEVAGTQAPGGSVTGYRVYMRKVNGGSKEIVYERTNLKSVTSYTTDDLESGEEYIFSIQAYQYNGWTAESTEVTLKACGAPTLLDPPVLVAPSSTQFELQWSPPMY